MHDKMGSYGVLILNSLHDKAFMNDAEILMLRLLLSWLIEISQYMMK